MTYMKRNRLHPFRILQITMRTGPVIERFQLRAARRRQCRAVWRKSLRADLMRRSFFDLVHS